MGNATGLITLIVEDHDFQRHTLARMLTGLGAEQVMEASDGKMALALLNVVSRVDLVLCDLDMPEMDGMEFLRHLGQAHSMASVIICSAQETPLLASVGKMATAYGVQLLGVIEKPVTPIKIEKLLENRIITKGEPARAGMGKRYEIAEILDGLHQGQFEAYYQPKIKVQTGEIIGAEALARWLHPEHGLVSPVAFIELLEQHKKIEALTHVMLEKAAQACLEWHRQGLTVSVSVNLSLVSLEDTKVADRITKRVRAAGLDPHHMILEVTETAAMTEVAPALENLNRLRMRGFGLSVDDYGTGFSSLRQLTRIPFSELKIDQGFVMGCTNNPSSRTIVETSVEMAKRLGIKSVAEGVETTEDLATLKVIGCELAQGFYIAKPMDKTAFQFFARAGKVSLSDNPADPS